MRRVVSVSGLFVARNCVWFVILSDVVVSVISLPGIFVFHLTPVTFGWSVFERAVSSLSLGGLVSGMLSGGTRVFLVAGLLLRVLVLPLDYWCFPLCSWGVVQRNGYSGRGSSGRDRNGCFFACFAVLRAIEAFFRDCAATCVFSTFISFCKSRIAFFTDQGVCTLVIGFLKICWL